MIHVAEYTTSLKIQQIREMEMNTDRDNTPLPPPRRMCNSAKTGLAGSSLHVKWLENRTWRDEPASPFSKKTIHEMAATVFTQPPGRGTGIASQLSERTVPLQGGGRGGFRALIQRALTGSAPLGLSAAILLLTFASPSTPQAAPIPSEPVVIGSEPQFLHDGYIVDNVWAIRYKRQAVQRVFHQPRKHPGNPILTGDQPSYLWVVRDEAAGLFRMYYQANIQVGNDSDKGANTIPKSPMRNPTMALNGTVLT